MVNKKIYRIEKSNKKYYWVWTEPLFGIKIKRKVYTNGEYVLSGKFWYHYDFFFEVNKIIN